MKRFLASIILCASLAVMVYGCATANPNAGKPVLNADGTTNHVEPPYIPNSTVTKGVDAVQPYVQYVPDPYKTPIEAGLTIATVIAGWFAKRKNDQASAATAVSTQLAASVVAQGPTVAQAVLDHASANETVYPAVANAVNLKTV